MVALQGARRARLACPAAPWGREPGVCLSRRFAKAGFRSGLAPPRPVRVGRVRLLRATTAAGMRGAGMRGGTRRADMAGVGESKARGDGHRRSPFCAEPTTLV